MSVSIPRLGKFLAIISPNKFSAPPFLSFFWDSYNTIVMFDRVIEFPKFILVLHNFSLSFLHLRYVLTITLCFRSLIHSFASSSLLFVTSDMFPILFIVLFIFDQFFFFF